MERKYRFFFRNFELFVNNIFFIPLQYLTHRDLQITLRRILHYPPLKIEEKNINDIKYMLSKKYSYNTIIT